MKHVLVFLVVVALGACGAPSPAAAPPASPPARADVELGRSLYLLDDLFVDQNGQTQHLDVHRGRPVLLAMFFASCPTVCPVLIGEMQRVLGKVDPALRDRARIVLVSLDPERDAPPQLQAVIERHRLDPQRATLMTGDHDGTRDVAALLGISYRKDEGTISHSSAIALLDEHGVVVTSAEPASAQMDDLVAKLRELTVRAPP